MKLRFYAFITALFLFFPMYVYSLPLIDAEIAAGGWFNSPGGEAGYKGDSLNLEKDLGYDSETKIGGRIRVELPLLLPNVTAMTTGLSYDGNYKTDKAFKFGNQIFDASTNFYSKVKLDHYDFAVSFSLPLLNLASLGKLQADIGVNLRLMEIEAEMEQTQGDMLIRESKSFTLPVPMGYVFLRVEPFSGLGFEAEGRLLSIGGNSISSILARVRYNVFGPLFIAGGYRIDKMDIDAKDVVIDTDFKGPFVEAGFKF